MRDLFSPKTCDWFAATLGEPTPVQHQGWRAIASGSDVLISAPTGTGKTLAAFLTAIDGLDRLAVQGELADELYVLYISPLKALGNDIRENLRRPLEGLNVPLRTAVRNGDTPSSERQRMQKKPPHILITTPESLYLMLTSHGGRQMLRTVRTVIVDELHAVISSRRGTHLMLSLTRLDALCARPPQRIGLSATLRPLALAAEYFSSNEVKIVAPEIEKRSEVRVLAAASHPNLLPEGSVWPEICREVYEASQRCRTVLVFCEGRATAEKVAHGVNELGGEGYARTHHGSISKEQRLEAERALKSGALKVMCATSSMELGIDVGEVDRVIQIGCPQRLTSAVQRLGRAGHRPGEVSRMDFYPRMKSELLLAAMTVQGMREGHLEAVEPQEGCLDILAQHLTSMAVTETYSVEEALALCRRCWCYRNLTEDQLTRVLRMLAGDDEHDADRPVSPRIDYDRLNGRVSGSPYTRMLALASGGTIPDRGQFAVVLEGGAADKREQIGDLPSVPATRPLMAVGRAKQEGGMTRLGELDEECVFEARVGDRFLLGAFAWSILRFERDRVVVRQCPAEGAQSPFWRGDGISRDYETGALFGGMLRRLEEAGTTQRRISLLTQWTKDRETAERIADYLSEQLEANGCLATDKTLVEEYFSDESGDQQWMLHCPFGGRVNQGLAVLLRAEAARRTGCDVRVWHDDDGILLHITGGEVPKNLLQSLSPDDVREQLRRELPGTALFSLLFRYNMNRALMMGVRSGGRMPLWIQRLRGAEALVRATKHPEHPMLAETLRDCMDRHIDADSLVQLLRELRSGRIRLVSRRVHEGRPSPMTLSLRRQVEAEMMYDYAPSHDFAAGLDVEALDRPTFEPEAEQLRQAHNGVSSPDSAEKLHEKLMIEGDLLAEETEAPFEWMQSLVDQGRAAYVEPGLWIAAEQAELYECALEKADEDAMARILRRCLRYRGPANERELAERYSPAEVRPALERLLANGEILQTGGGFVHAEVYQRAQHMTLRARRRAITTAEPSAYAAFLAGWQREVGSPRERLAASLHRLSGLVLPLEQWESVVLPARTADYRPQMLDELLAAGEITWRISDDGQKLAFFDPENVDWEAEPPVHVDSESAAKVRSLLLRRGASFSSSIAAALPGESAANLLTEMARRGDVVCDSLAPLRKQPVFRSTKQRVRARISATGGRWELARPIRPRTMEERLNAAFDRWGIFCRETAAMEELRFADALTLLQRMEFTAQVRRGYFVRGMSGAQFVRVEDFERICAALREPDPTPVCLNATDPAQAWGRALKHDPERGFLCVPGTAIVLSGGEIHLVLERSGSVLRTFEAQPQDYAAVAESFRTGRLFPQLNLLVIKNYPIDAIPSLEAVGFIREMRDYVLDRSGHY